MISCFFIEMCPKWFDHDQIPFNDMWPDDTYWLPSLLQKKTFHGYFKFEGHSKILESKLDIKDS